MHDVSNTEPYLPLRVRDLLRKVAQVGQETQTGFVDTVIMREQVATINTCLFCMDAARYFAMKESVGNLARFEALADYRTSPLFTEAERAALDHATELTRDKKVSTQ